MAPSSLWRLSFRYYWYHRAALYCSICCTVGSASLVLFLLGELPYARLFLPKRLLFSPVFSEHPKELKRWPCSKLMLHVICTCCVCNRCLHQSGDNCCRMMFFQMSCWSAQNGRAVPIQKKKGNRFRYFSGQFCISTDLLQIHTYSEFGSLTLPAC